MDSEIARLPKFMQHLSSDVYREWLVDITDSDSSAEGEHFSSPLCADSANKSDSPIASDAPDAPDSPDSLGSTPSIGKSNQDLFCAFLEWICAQNHKYLCFWLLASRQLDLLLGVKYHADWPNSEELHQ